VGPEKGRAQRSAEVKQWILLLGMLVFGGVQAQQARADNLPPPSGAILDLAGNPITTTYTLYTVDFTAAFAATDVTFAFRDDPGFIAFDDVTMADLTTPGPNLVTNGGFETGDLSGWTYDNVYGVSFGGMVSDGCLTLGNNSGNAVWCDGATQGYDAIDQVVVTTPGDTYQISFYVAGIGVTGYQPTNFQDLSTNGNPPCVTCLPGTSGNGVDVLVYEGASIPPIGGVPEPSSLMMLGSGLLGLGFAASRKRVR